MAAPAHNRIEEAYAQDEDFWTTYVRGHPPTPQTLFDRIAAYHTTHNGQFEIAHDVGAGVGVHSARLRSLFQHVIVSDVVEQNVEIAQKRLGTEGFSFRTAPIEEARDLETGSVDLVFAATMMHFADMDRAYAALGKQLRPGGTLAIFVAGSRVLDDPAAQEVWLQLWHEGIRVLFRNMTDRKKNLLRLGHVGDGYDSILVPKEFYRPGALRLRINEDAWSASLLNEIEAEYREVNGVAGIDPDDVIQDEKEAGWTFTTNIDGFRETFATYSFARLEPHVYEPYWEKLEQMLGYRDVQGVWPARLILATRK